MDQSPLAELREALALTVGENAVFDGWTRAAVDSAAAQLGIEQAQARLAMPKTQTGMIEAYIDAVDRALEQALPPKKLAALKIRERIRLLVWTRLEIMAPQEEVYRHIKETVVPEMKAAE